MKQKSKCSYVLDRAWLLLLQGLWSFKLGCSASRDLCGCSWQSPISFGSPIRNNGTHAFIPQLCWLSDGALGKELVWVVSRLFHCEESIRCGDRPWAEEIHHSNLKARCAQLLHGQWPAPALGWCVVVLSVEQLTARQGTTWVKPTAGVQKHPARHWLSCCRVAQLSSAVNFWCNFQPQERASHPKSWAGSKLHTSISGRGDLALLLHAFNHSSHLHLQQRQGKGQPAAFHLWSTTTLFGKVGED